jgi:CHAT domain-containing protein
VQAAIPSGAALIEFAVYRPFDPTAEINSETYGEPRYVAYIVRSQGEVQGTDLGAVRVIDADITRLREALRDPARRDVRQLAQALDAKVMKPLRPLLGDATQLLISPDGALNLIPFAALVDERGSYLVERYSLTYLTSGRDLLRLQVARDSKSPAVVLADPAFGEPQVIEARAGGKGTSKVQLDHSQVFFGPLPGVGAEVRALKELLPRATFLTRADATKAALKQVRAPRILHIATHGFFLQNDPRLADRITQTKDTRQLSKQVTNVENPLLRSGLALAGANQSVSEDDNGVLTAFEMAHLNLWGTKLVVLSACDTGIGEIKNGEGVYGMRRALVLAGTESQMVSLWPVSDSRTRYLMVGYYQLLLQNQGRGEALRQVQLEMLSSKTHGHPYYWASFIQSGEWANLKGER